QIMEMTAVQRLPTAHQRLTHLGGERRSHDRTPSAGTLNKCATSNPEKRERVLPAPKSVALASALPPRRVHTVRMTPLTTPRTRKPESLFTTIGEYLAFAATSSMRSLRGW